MQQLKDKIIAYRHEIEIKNKSLTDLVGSLFLAKSEEERLEKITNLNTKALVVIQAL